MTERYLGMQDFDHGSAGRIGVLLVNLGTPDAADTRSVRRYLAEFLWDPRVIEIPRAAWWLILHGVILRVRPARSARAYASVWTGQGSPLMVNSQAQASALEEVLERDAPGRFKVALAMRYGKPDIAGALQQLESAGARRVMVLPLYPQYSGTTTGSVFDAVGDALRRRRWVPHLVFNSDYHDAPGYVTSVADSIRDAWRECGEPQRLLFSFHGIPRRYFLAGDPYHCQCHHSAGLIARELGLPAERWQLSFQSRVGREEWLRPYTDEVLDTWGREGVESVDVVCPGFAADCLETLEEIAVENRDRFVEAGGGTLRYIPALNARPDHVEMLARLVTDNTAAWHAWADAEAHLAAARPNPRHEAAAAMGAER